MKTPYLAVVDEPRRMSGKGAPRQTTFGVLGMTREDPFSRSLGGLVKDTATGKVQPGTVTHNAKMIHTERGITGNISKTHVPGDHYAQVPYAGTYMCHDGKRLS